MEIEVSLSQNDLQQIREIIKDEVNKRADKEIEGRLLSPDETRKLFKPAISLPTLNSYTKQGKLKKYRIGSRVWYKYGEVMRALEQIKYYSNGK